MEKPIIAITGPTASGKTAIALEVVPKFNGGIIAADSTTVYEGLNIGTDKPDTNKVKHYLVDIVDPNEEFNVALFQEKAAEAVCEIEKENKIPFFVGGSLLYLDAFIYGYGIPKPGPDDELRAKLEKRTNEDLFEELVRLDPQAEMAVDKNNKRRLVRALEVTLNSGEPFTRQKRRKELPQNVLYLAVQSDREELYAKINRRVDKMFESGLVGEVEKLYEKYGDVQSLQTAGYRQVLEYLKGECSLEEAVEKTKQAHRNYAKRQMTWLRANPDVTWIKDAHEAEAKIREFLG